MEGRVRYSGLPKQGGLLLTIEVDRNVNGDEFIGKVVDIEIHREKRSLDANAYMWVLCSKIAEAIHNTNVAVYQSAIRDVGMFKDIKIERKDLYTIKHIWNSYGTGCFTELLEDIPGENTVIIRCYYGSSTYNTKQMSRLIDYIVQEAKELDIETMPPAEIERLKGLWANTADT